MSKNKKKLKTRSSCWSCYQNHQEKVRSNLGVTRFRKCNTTAADNEAICCKMANVQIILSKFSTFENVSRYFNLTYQPYLTMLHKQICQFAIYLFMIFLISKKKNEMFLNLLIWSIFQLKIDQTAKFNETKFEILH